VIANRLRQLAGILVLAVLVILGVKLLPIYLHNQELQQFVDDVTHRPATPTTSNDVIRSWILAKAADLELPVLADNVHIKRSPESVNIEVRYAVTVNLPLYTVDLHFYPGAGSR